MGVLPVPLVGCLFSLLDLPLAGTPPFSVELPAVPASSLLGCAGGFGGGSAHLAASAAACCIHRKEGEEGREEEREEVPLPRNKYQR